MDLLGYAALGGLERLTIVAGAVIIGYWGYRLYTAEKNAGLVFMGLAVVVLIGALATGGSYLKSVGEGYQLASLPAEAPEADSPSEYAATAERVNAPAAVIRTEPVIAPDNVPEPAAPPVAEQTVAEQSAEAIPTTAAIEPAVEPETADAPDAPDAERSAAEPSSPAEIDESPVRIATGAELGGRIVSVKSENVSLEWSSESEDPEESGSGSE